MILYYHSFLSVHYLCYCSWKICVHLHFTYLSSLCLSTCHGVQLNVLLWRNVSTTIDPFWDISLDLGQSESGSLWPILQLLYIQFYIYTNKLLWLIFSIGTSIHVFIWKWIKKNVMILKKPSNEIVVFDFLSKIIKSTWSFSCWYCLKAMWMASTPLKTLPHWRTVWRGMISNKFPECW